MKQIFSQFVANRSQCQQRKATRRCTDNILQVAYTVLIRGLNFSSCPIPNDIDVNECIAKVQEYLNCNSDGAWIVQYNASRNEINFQRVTNLISFPDIEEVRNPFLSDEEWNASRVDRTASE